MFENIFSFFFSFYYFIFFRYYTITAPNVLRPNSDYHVAVSVQGTTQPTQVLVEVGGKQDSGGTFKTNQVTAVPPYTTQIVKLEVNAMMIKKNGKVVAPWALSLMAKNINS